MHLRMERDFAGILITALVADVAWPKHPTIALVAAMTWAASIVHFAIQHYPRGGTTVPREQPPPVDRSDTQPL